MEFRLNTNMTAHRAVLGINNGLTSMYQAMERLSSGRRINRASDDPAGLVISKQLQGQIASLNQEIDNLSANINKYQTVSSSVMGLRSHLTELRSLAVGAANESINSEEAVQAYTMAAESLVNTYNRSVANASYNGANTLDGSEGSLASVAELTSIDLSSPEAAVASIERIDAVASELDGVTVDLGATQKYELESRRSSLEVTRENLVAAESSVGDADYALEFSNFIGSMLRSQAAVAMLSHTLLSGRNVVTLLDM